MAATNPPRVVVPASGDTITMHFKDGAVYVNKDSTLAALTIKLPNAPYLGDTATFMSKSEITALTVLDGAGDPPDLTMPTELLAGDTSVFMYINRTIGWRWNL